MNNNKLVKNYGIMILKKYSILYHTSDNEILNNLNENEVPFLFCSIHPSEYGSTSNYVHIYRLKRDIKLFFMVYRFGIKKNMIKTPYFFSSFESLLGFNKTNLKFISNIHKEKLEEFIRKLKLLKFDGWFSSINNFGLNFEVALFNNKNLFEYIGVNEININRINWNGINNYLTFRNKYNITTLEYPITLVINIKYKSMIEKLFNNILSNGNLKPKSIFDIIIHNAQITYFDDRNNIINADNALEKYV